MVFVSVPADKLVKLNIDWNTFNINEVYEIVKNSKIFFIVATFHTVQSLIHEVEVAAI